MSFFELPLDLHTNISDYLDHDDLLALSTASRHTCAAYGPALQTHLRLDGTESLLQFLIQHYVTTHFDPDDEQPSNSSLLSVRHVELYEVGVIWRGQHEVRISNLLTELGARTLSEANGGPIGAVLALLPNLTTLKVLQTPLALMSGLADKMVERVPQLRSLTFHSPHIDSGALATVIEGLPHLHTLDVSGVRTCACRGKIGQLQGMLELTYALRSASELGRLVMTSSRVFAVQNGEFLEALALEGSELRLKSLELRRSPVRGQALARFLQSPVCKGLSHLFVGGCKRVRSRHLSHLPEAGEIELDGSLLSPEALPRSTSRLRIYEPGATTLANLSDVIRKGRLPHLEQVTLLPRRDAAAAWLERDPIPLEVTLEKHGRPGAAVVVGDSQWWRVRREEIKTQSWNRAKDDGHGDLDEDQQVTSSAEIDAYKDDRT